MTAVASPRAVSPIGQQYALHVLATLLGDPALAQLATLAAMVSRSGVLLAVRAALLGEAAPDAAPSVATVRSAEVHPAAYSFLSRLVETNNPQVLESLVASGAVGAAMHRLAILRQRRGGHVSLTGGSCSHCVFAMHDSVHKKKAQIAAHLATLSRGSGGGLAAGLRGPLSPLASSSVFPFITDLNDSSNSSGSGGILSKVGGGATGSGGAGGGGGVAGARGSGGANSMPDVCLRVVQYVLEHFRAALDPATLRRFEQAAHETPQEANDDVQSSEAASRANSKAALITDAEFTAMLREFGPDAEDATLLTSASGSDEAAEDATPAGAAAGMLAEPLDQEFTLVRSRSVRALSSGNPPQQQPGSVDDGSGSPTALAPAAAAAAAPASTGAEDGQSPTAKPASPSHARDESGGIRLAMEEDPASPVPTGIDWPGASSVLAGVGRTSASPPNGAEGVSAEPVLKKFRSEPASGSSASPLR